MAGEKLKFRVIGHGQRSNWRVACDGFGAELYVQVGKAGQPIADRGPEIAGSVAACKGVIIGPSDADKRIDGRAGVSGAGT